MHLHLLRSSFPSMMFCSFQCTGVAPLLNLFPIILFFCCYNKWNCFLNFIIEFPSSILYDSFFSILTKGHAFYLFWREKKGERERPAWAPTRDWTHNLGYVPWLGTESATFWCMGWCSNQLSNPARAIWFLISETFNYIKKVLEKFTAFEYESPGSSNYYLLEGGKYYPIKQETLKAIHFAKRSPWKVRIKLCQIILIPISVPYSATLLTHRQTHAHDYALYSLIKYTNKKPIRLYILFAKVEGNYLSVSCNAIRGSLPLQNYLSVTSNKKQSFFVPSKIGCFH